MSNVTASALPSLPPVPPDIGRSAGPLLLGYLFNWGLYGVLMVQGYLYYLGFPNDPISSKCIVAAILAVETLQTILVTHDVFMAYAAGFGNINALIDAQLEWLATPIISGVVSASVQIFFAYRIMRISGSKIIPILIVMLALMQGGAAITQGVQAKIIGNFAQLQTEAATSATIWLAGSAACDVIIALSMTFYLSRRNTGFRRTQAIINKVIRLTVETGSLTATFAVIDIILYLAFKTQNYHTTPALTLAKLYSNTLLVIFNSRLRIVGGRGDSGEDTTSLELGSRSAQVSRSRHIDTIGAQSMNRPTISFVKPPAIGMDGISVQKEVWTHAEGDAELEEPLGGRFPEQKVTHAI